MPAVGTDAVIGSFTGFVNTVNCSHTGLGNLVWYIRNPVHPNTGSFAKRKKRTFSGDSDLQFGM